MDIITQGLAGAVLAQSVARKPESRTALWVGFLAGLLADVDALWMLADSDPLLQLDFHRHFTHSIFFIPIGGLIAALLLWPWVKTQLAFSRLLLFTMVAYATSGLLDACTSYGTSLLWPVSDARIAWNIIAIVDPIFSLSLLAAIIYAAKRFQPHYARVGLSMALGYLMIGMVQHDRAEAVAMEVANTRGHAVERMQIKPTMGNLLVWRSIYEADGQFYVDAVRAGVWSDPTWYVGESVKHFSLVDLPALPADSRLALDMQRFAFFSHDYVALHSDDAGQLWLGDIRYAMAPISAKPIWGLRIDLQAQNQHPAFEQFHHDVQGARKLFVDLLLDDAPSTMAKEHDRDHPVPEKQIVEGTNGYRG